MEVRAEQDKALKLSMLRLCFYLTLVSNLVIFIAQPLDIVILESLASRCLMLCNMAAFFLTANHCLKQYIPYKVNQILTIVFILGFSFVSYELSSGSGMYSYIIRMWCYLALPFYFLYIDYLKPDRKMINFIFITSFLVSVLFIFLSFSKYSYAGYEAFLGTNRAWLTLGYDNPNQTAMYLLIIIIILFCAFHFYKKRYARLLILLDIIYMAKLLTDTSSRTCIIIAILVAAAILFKRKYTVSRYIVAGILLLPAIFMFAYPYLYEHGWVYLFEMGGKADFSARSYIFQATLSSVSDKILFGDFGTYQLQNLHNGALSVYASLGLVGLLFFYIYYFRAYFNILKNEIRSRTAYISFIGLLAVFIHACTEGAFIIGGSMYAGSLSILIFLVKLDGKEVQLK